MRTTKFIYCITIFHSFEYFTDDRANEQNGIFFFCARSRRTLCVNGINNIFMSNKQRIKATNVSEHEFTYEGVSILDVMRKFLCVLFPLNTFLGCFFSLFFWAVCEWSLVWLPSAEYLSFFCFSLNGRPVSMPVSLRQMFNDFNLSAFATVWRGRERRKNERTNDIWPFAFWWWLCVNGYIICMKHFNDVTKIAGQ